MAAPNSSRTPGGAGPDREKALDSALGQIERQFGKGSVMRLGSEGRAPVEVIPTGSIALDVALGIGGLPRGRVVEIYGPEASGKTTLALHAIASAQAGGGIAAIIDAEHALDPDYAKALGVDIDALLVSQPDNGEQALEIADMLIRSGAIDLVVIDSVAALVPKAEIEGEMGDSHVGLQARLMSQALRKITGALSNSGTTAIFINQLREKIGVYFGSPETTTGGKALKFYASVRLDVRRIETLKDGTDAVGNRTRVKVVKNKCLAAGSRIYDPVTGATHRIEDVVEGRLPIHVVAMDKKGQLAPSPVTGWFDQGEQSVVRVVLRGGAAITVTPDHKLWTERGWVMAGSLKPGDRVARPRVLSTCGQDGAFAEAVYLPEVLRDEVLGRIRTRGATTREVAVMLGRPATDGAAGLRQLLGTPRLRRDRVHVVAEALDDQVLRELLSEDVAYATVRSVEPAGQAPTYDLEVDEFHTFVADGIVVHNCASPFKQAEFDMLYGQGISREGGLIDLGVEQGLVRKSGAWYTYEGDQLGQGKENARAFLKDNPDLANEIEKRILEKLGIGAQLDAEVEGDIDDIDVDLAEPAPIDV
jgi:protein RecA